MRDTPQYGVNNGRNRGTEPGQRDRDCPLDRYRDGGVCFGTLYRQAPVGMCAIGFDPGRFKAVSDCMLEHLGYARQEFMQLTPSDLLTPTAYAHFDRLCEEIRSGHRETLWVELALRCKDTRVLETLVAIRGILENGCTCGVTMVLVADDTTQAVNPEQKNNQLEEINTALQTLVKIREIDRAELEETVVANIHQLADPLLVRLKASGLNERQKSYVAILEANLHEVITPFAQQIATRYLELTPAEVEVANLVKHGRKSKEIGSLLNISTRTVEMHRRNIRKKLGLQNKHANLRTFLLSKSTA